MVPDSFSADFEELTGHAPFRWQERLYERWFVQNKFPDCIELPTGTGKTAVIAVWLLARIQNPILPRGLVYVVDRRTVVDQATRLAERIAAKAPAMGITDLAISTLRGQRADNREWTRDLSHPAIVIGTVDLIGSGLLFSGYRSGYKRRPLEAGLLGQDALLILDEAHLSRPFERLITKIREFQQDAPGRLQIVRMSATAGQAEEGKVFRLDAEEDLRPIAGPDGKETNQIRLRYCAPKHFSFVAAGTGGVADKLADEAWGLAKSEEAVGKRIAIFVREPAQAKAVADKLRKKLGKGAHEEQVQILTGTMRGLERDALVSRPVFVERWLNGELEPAAPANAEAVFLVSTSAGEVGMDLNADHLVGDAAPVDSWIQRLGRVNRRGMGQAEVRLIEVEAKKPKTEGKAREPSPLDKSIASALVLLRGISDVSPENIDRLRRDEWKEQYAAGCAPTPAVLGLTDILLDAWSMTTIVGRLPGRPAVAPWLRGVAAELPQTTIAWRAELDLPGFGDLEAEEVEEWFEHHRILPHEILTERADHAADWCAKRWAELGAERQARLGGLAVIVERGEVERRTLREMANLAEDKSKRELFENAQITLPAAFGGIGKNKDGLLHADAEAASGTDVGDYGGRVRLHETRDEDGSTRWFNLVTGESVAAVPPGLARFAVALPGEGDDVARLVSYVPRADRAGWDSYEQSLSAHVDAVYKQMEGIVERLGLGAQDPVARAARLAARYHDHGKNRAHWQRLAGGEATGAGRSWTDGTRGKAKTLRRDPRRYRHEFGSVRELMSCGAAGDEEALALALHLIAAHHGRARPHFPAGGFDPEDENASPELRGEVMRRYARLQRKYGWWRLAWLESLLRCADGLGSAEGVAEAQAAAGGGR